MKKNGGFTYPLTLSLLILFLTMFTFNIEQLLTEKKTQHELAITLQEDYYFLLSVKKIENLYKTAGSVSSEGAFYFKNGTMNYQPALPSGTLQKITFTLHLRSGEQVTSRGFFDINLKTLSKWLNS